jgi:multiple sugar transport system substrate-binding protein
MRGHECLVAATEHYAQTHDVRVEWTPRTLTEFGVLDVGRLAAEFDLVVIDHPHVGGASATGSLAMLDVILGANEIARLGVGSPGESHQSYHYDGHQWALAIDAACQVSAHRADLVGELPATWADVVELARAGRVLWPINPVDIQASFLTIAAQLGRPIDGTAEDFVPHEVGVEVFEKMHAVIRYLDPRCFDMNAIGALEELAGGEGTAAYCPLVFGYTNYSRVGFRSRLVLFGDVPTFDFGQLPTGALLGGVGLAVSASSAFVREAAGVALWLAGPEAQAGVILEAGGQPAHPAAWENEQANALVGRFFTSVRRTMNGSWMRPRSPGYVAWQNASLDVIHTALRIGAGFDSAVDELNRLARPFHNAN